MTNMAIEQPISMRKAYLIATSFFLLGALMMTLTIAELLDMLGEIRNEDTLVTLDMGMYYLFGGGLFFFVMVIGVEYPKLFNKPLPRGIDKFLALLLLSGIVLMFVLPHVVYAFVDDYLQNNHYVICEAKSTQWLHVRTIVYTKTLPCD